MTSTPRAPRVAWVTGGSGFLPSHVCRKFAEKGWVVGAIGRRRWASPDRFGVAAWVESALSVTALAELSQLTGNPAAVFHGAGTSTVGDARRSPETAARDTVASTSELIEFLAGEAPEAILLYPSSCAVYGAGAPVPTPETAPQCRSPHTGVTSWRLNSCVEKQQAASGSEWRS